MSLATRGGGTSLQPNADWSRTCTLVGVRAFSCPPRMLNSPPLVSASRPLAVNGCWIGLYSPLASTYASASSSSGPSRKSRNTPMDDPQKVSGKDRKRVVKEERGSGGGEID